MNTIDVPEIEAKFAYLDPEEMRCMINNLICRDGDCRRCSFVSDGSLSYLTDSICNELEIIRYLLGEDFDDEDDESSCGCGCSCDSEDEKD